MKTSVRLRVSLVALAVVLAGCSTTDADPTMTRGTSSSSGSSAEGVSPLEAQRPSTEVDVPADTAIVPDVVGLTGDLAHASITSAGFDVNFEVEGGSDWHESEVRIESQSPPGGSEVGFATKITLVGTVQDSAEIPTDEPTEDRGFVAPESPDEGDSPLVP